MATTYSSRPPSMPSAPSVGSRPSVSTTAPSTRPRARPTTATPVSQERGRGSVYSGLGSRPASQDNNDDNNKNKSFFEKLRDIWRNSGGKDNDNLKDPREPKPMAIAPRERDEDGSSVYTSDAFTVKPLPALPEVKVEELEPDTESTQLAIRKATEQTLGIMQIQEYLDKIKKEQEKTELKTPDFIVESTKAGEERGREGMYGKGLMSPDKQQEKSPPEMDMLPPSSGIENEMTIVRNYLNDEMYSDSPLNQTKLKIQGDNFSKRQAAIEEIARGFSNSYTDAQVAALKATMDAESESSLVEKGYTKARALQVFTNQDADYYPALQALPNNASKEDIFNVVYGGRMGNTEPGDGNKYRGRGVIQITGKNNYREISQRLGLGDLLVDNPDLVATNPDIMIAATKEYLNMKGFGNTELSANSLKDTIGHAGGAAEAEERWEETLQNLRSAGEEDTADDLELNNEFTAQRTAGTTVDGDIGPNSLRAFRAWLTRANIPVPQNATPLQLVRLINANS